MTPKSRTLRFFAPVVLPLVAALSLGCAPTSESDTASQSADQTSKKATIALVITVDWEGRDLTDANLAAMNTFRSTFPTLPLVHFLNAAYFTKPDADPSAVEAKIKSVIREGDELGLHIHGWKRLFEASGVTFRSTPTFWGNGPLSNDCAYDCGHEVPISAYTASELSSVVRYSVKTLKGHGFGTSVSFRAGGWVATESVRAALLENGFKTENSEVPVTYLKAKLGTMPLYTWLDDLWAGASNLTQPHTLSNATGSLTEVPDNGALSDYVSAEDMLAVYRANRAATAKGSVRVVSIGFHQETAAKYLPVLTDAITRIQADAAKDATVILGTTSIAVANALAGGTDGGLTFPESASSDAGSK